VDCHHLAQEIGFQHRGTVIAWPQKVMNMMVTTITSVMKVSDEGLIPTPTESGNHEQPTLGESQPREASRQGDPPLRLGALHVPALDRGHSAIDLEQRNGIVARGHVMRMPQQLDSEHGAIPISATPAVPGAMSRIAASAMSWVPIWTETMPVASWNSRSYTWELMKFVVGDNPLATGDALSRRYPTNTAAQHRPPGPDTNRVAVLPQADLEQRWTRIP